jgi:hypothetical protein
MQNTIVRRQMRCGRCGNEGHNKRNRKCPMLVADDRDILVQRRWCIVSSISINRRLSAFEKISNIHQVITSEEYRRLLNRNRNHEADTLEILKLLEELMQQYVLEIDIDDDYQYIRNLPPYLHDFARQARIRLRRRLELYPNLFTVYALPKLTKTVLKSIPITIGVFEEESYDCSICLNTCERMSVAHTNCKHAFCLVCVCDYTSSIKEKTIKPNCPLCRTELSTLKVSCEEKKQVLETHLRTL